METGIDIRQTTEKDIPLLVDFFNKLAEYEQGLGLGLFSDESLDVVLVKFTTFVRSNMSLTYIIQVDGEAIGFVSAEPWISSKQICIAYFYLQEDYRQKGYGSTVIEGLQYSASNQGYTLTVNCVYDQNISAINFYMKHNIKILHLLDKDLNTVDPGVIYDE